jgi:ectoine hydroxylase-related dioxygenase (phytanoyl-CoA dioxygenase family)
VLNTRTPSAVDRLLTDGYCIIPAVLDADRCRAMHSRLVELYRTDPGASARRVGVSDIYSVENLIAKDELFEDFFLAEPVLTPAESLLGHDCTLQEVWSYGLPPFQGEAAGVLGKVGTFHYDDPLLLPVPLTVVTVWPLVDFTSQNGATEVVPASHLLGRPPSEDELAQAVIAELAAGDCLLMLGSTWHRAGRNHTDQLRVSIGAIYGRPWLKPILDLTRALPPEIVHRASDRGRRLFGLASRTPFTERWQWDYPAGRPDPRKATDLDRFGPCCLGQPGMPS